jgi:hypothetical protein
MDDLERRSRSGFEHRQFSLLAVIIDRFLAFFPRLFLYRRFSSLSRMALSGHAAFILVAEARGLCRFVLKEETTHISTAENLLGGAQEQGVHRGNRGSPNDKRTCCPIWSTPSPDQRVESTATDGSTGAFSGRAGQREKESEACLNFDSS